MFIPRHLLLYAAIAATCTATAQGMCSRVTDHSDAHEEPGLFLVAMPALGQVVAFDAGSAGDMKADVFRYKYKQKVSAVPVHTVVGGTGHGTAGAQQEVDRSTRSKRLVIE